jgi:GT2 family glycosyltransferase
VTQRVRVGVVVLDHGRPADAARAALSARDASLEMRILVVENGTGGSSLPANEVLHLPENRGFAGGMNAGIERLIAEGCDAILLLNNDAVLEPGCVRQLSEALENAQLAAAGPVVIREADGRVESQGVRIDLGSGRVRLLGNGEAPEAAPGLAPVQALSGAVMMLSRAALERVGRLDESYFFSFEDLDWCLRARKAGFEVAVVRGARARHAGSQTIGRGTAERLYYASRNHLVMVERLEPREGPARWLRRCRILALNLAHALRQRELPRRAAVAAVLAGFGDARLGRSGRRSA